MYRPNARGIGRHLLGRQRHCGRERPPSNVDPARACRAAPAANLRYTFVATAGTVIVNGPTITAGQETLFLDWLWEFYAPVDGTGAKMTRNSANEAQAYRNWAAAAWKGTAAQVRDWKRRKDQEAITEPTLPGE